MYAPSSRLGARYFDGHTPRESQGTWFIHGDIHAMDTQLIETDRRYVFRQALEQAEIRALYHGHNAIFDGLVVHGILESVALPGLSEVGKHCNIDHDVLFFASFPIIDAENATGAQVSKMYFVESWIHSL
jgi:hypothetical protein